MKICSLTFQDSSTSGTPLSQDDSGFGDPFNQQVKISSGQDALQLEMSSTQSVEAPSRVVQPSDTVLASWSWWYLPIAVLSLLLATAVVRMLAKRRARRLPDRDAPESTGQFKKATRFADSSRPGRESFDKALDEFDEIEEVRRDSAEPPESAEDANEDSIKPPEDLDLDLDFPLATSEEPQAKTTDDEFALSEEIDDDFENDDSEIDIQAPEFDDSEFHPAAESNTELEAEIEAQEKVAVNFDQDSGDADSHLATIHEEEALMNLKDDDSNAELELNFEDVDFDLDDSSTSSEQPKLVENLDSASKGVVKIDTEDSEDFSDMFAESDQDLSSKIDASEFAEPAHKKSDTGEGQEFNIEEDLAEVEIARAEAVAVDEAASLDSDEFTEFVAIDIDMVSDKDKPVVEAAEIASAFDEGSNGLENARFESAGIEGAALESDEFDLGEMDEADAESVSSFAEDVSDQVADVTEDNSNGVEDAMSSVAETAADAVDSAGEMATGTKAAVAGAAVAGAVASNGFFSRLFGFLKPKKKVAIADSEMADTPVAHGASVDDEHLAVVSEEQSNLSSVEIDDDTEALAANVDEVVAVLEIKDQEGANEKINLEELNDSAEFSFDPDDDDAIALGDVDAAVSVAAEDKHDQQDSEEFSSEDFQQDAAISNDGQLAAAPVVSESNAPMEFEFDDLGSAPVEASSVGPETESVDNESLDQSEAEPLSDEFDFSDENDAFSLESERIPEQPDTDFISASSAETLAEPSEWMSEAANSSLQDDAFEINDAPDKTQEMPVFGSRETLADPSVVLNPNAGAEDMGAGAETLLREANAEAEKLRAELASMQAESESMAQLKADFASLEKEKQSIESSLQKLQSELSAISKEKEQQTAVLSDPKNAIGEEQSIKESKGIGVGTMAAVAVAGAAGVVTEPTSPDTDSTNEVSEVDTNSVAYERFQRRLKKEYKKRKNAEKYLIEAEEQRNEVATALRKVRLELKEQQQSKGKAVQDSVSSEEIAKLKNELEAAVQNSQELKSQLEELEKEHATAIAAQKGLENEKTTRLADIKTLSESVSELDALRSKLAEAEGDKAKLTESLSTQSEKASLEFSTQLNSLTSKLTQTSNLAEENAASFKASELKVSELKSKLASAEDKVLEKEKVLLNSETKLQEVKSELEEIASQLAELKDSHKREAESASAAELDRIATLELEKENLTSERSEFQETISELKKLQEGSSLEIATLKEQLSVSEQATSKLQDSINENSGTSTKLEQTLAGRNDQIAELQLELEAEQDKSTKLSEELTAKTEAESTTTQQLAEKEALLVEFKQSVAKLDVALTARTESTSDLEYKLTTLTSSLAEVQEQLNAQRSTNAALKQSLEEQKESAAKTQKTEESMSRLELKISDLKRDRDLEIKQRLQIEEELEAARKNLETTSNKLVVAEDSQSAAQNDEIVRLQKSVKETEEELASERTSKANALREVEEQKRKLSELESAAAASKDSEAEQQLRDELRDQERRIMELEAEHHDALELVASLRKSQKEQEVAAQKSLDFKTEKRSKKKATSKKSKSSAKDDLTKMKGVGSVLNTKLQRFKVTSFDQISKWTKTDVASWEEKLDWTSIGKDEWVKQAKALAKAKKKK